MGLREEMVVVIDKEEVKPSLRAYGSQDAIPACQERRRVSLSVMNETPEL